MPPKNEKGKQRKMAMKQVRSAIKGLMQGEVRVVRPVGDDTFEQAADKAFSELDTDGSGFLEKAELLSALNSLIGAGEDERAIPEKKFEKFFGKLDTDGDEKISKDEFKTLAKRLFKQLQKRISAEWRRGPARGDIPRRRPDREADRVARSRRRTWPTRPGFSVGDVNRSGPVRLVSLTSDISRVGPRFVPGTDRALVAVASFIYSLKTRRLQDPSIIMPPKKNKKNRTKKMGKGKIKTALQSLMEGEDNMKKAVNTAFEKLDTDGSGFLEKEELFEALNEVLGADDDENGIPEKQFNKFFEKLDKDEDGKISKEEFGKRARGFFKKMQEVKSSAIAQTRVTFKMFAAPCDFIIIINTTKTADYCALLTVTPFTLPYDYLRRLCPDVLLLHSAASQTYDMRAVVARCRTVCTVGTNPFDASMSVTLNLSFFPQADGEDDDD
ncbi:hypothetical protein Bbelb_431130 [Branchiostoma belcheri]|nr:hypothetical protein Bbelb_431130 [Branchiostoma belcheri]